MKVQDVEVKSILTRTSGYLATVCSHTLQPYRGCSYGKSLCGTACYVQHNPFVTKGREWGSFLEVRVNAAEVYRKTVSRERNFVRRKGKCFSIFMSSSTDPFIPQEKTRTISRSLLEEMLESPPDELIVQTHSPTVCDVLDVLPKLSELCDLRIHISIESDLAKLPGLPKSAYSVDARLQAARRLKASGLTVVITMAPLLPLFEPAVFFQRCSEVSDAIVIDHFIGGDGSKDGQRTRRTLLPKAMEKVCEGSSGSDYREQVLDWAKQHYRGRLGIGIDGFAARYLPR